MNMYEINVELRKELDEEDKKRIIKEIKSHQNIDGIIASIFALSKRDRISADPKYLHNTFYSLKKKFPEILIDFIFNESEVYHFSKLLERVFFRLQNAGIIGMTNLKFDFFEITENARENILQDFYEKYDEKKQEILQKMKEEFLILSP